MLDEKIRNAIALKRFSLISPVINGQVKNNKAYFCEITATPIEMPHFGLKKYSPKTLENWYCEYMHGGIDGLKPSIRGDKGGSRKIDNELKKKILDFKSTLPKAPNSVVYEELIKNNIINPAEISIPTFYRFLNNSVKSGAIKEDDEKEIKRFSYEKINNMWQTDVMYGPYIVIGKQKKATYLFAYIDDASRLITHAQFYYEQSFDSLRHSFKEAVLKRGVPTLLYTDNGKIYRSQQLEYICASIGCTLIHTKPFSPREKGKIERFFHTVRDRFLSLIDPTKLKTIDELNLKFFEWLHSEYQKKPHSAHKTLSPLDYFMSQDSTIKLFSSPAILEEKFLLRINRKIIHDATFTINNILFETNSKFVGMKIEIRYDPEWLKDSSKPVFIYDNDTVIGEGRQVNFHDNAHVKRKGRPVHNNENKIDTPSALENEINLDSNRTISFNDIMEGTNNV